MADLHVARQPIFDARLQVVAYELLFRAGARTDTAGVVDANGATASVLLSAFAELDVHDILGGKPAWVNMPWQLLLDDPPLPEPPDRIVVELLEGAPATPEVVTAVQRLKRRGYAVALDDFEDDGTLEPLVAEADVIKIDVLAQDLDAVAAQVRALSRFRVRLLAEKVETHERYEECRALGFELFQGFFLSRPRTLTGATVGSGSASRLALLATLNDPAAEAEDLAREIGRDVGLSYKLLRYVNSAFFSLPRTVTSVRDALTLLGTRAARRWASLAVMASIEDQPPALLATALVRARTCELLALAAGARAEADGYYTTGLFSVADALMSRPLRDVLAGLPLADDIRAALLDHAGDKGAALAAIKDFERGREPELPAPLLAAMGGAYLDAVRHADAVAAVAVA